LEIRRGFSTFQLMTILEEACHSLIIVEHDPMLYEDSTEMVEYNPRMKLSGCYTRLESIPSWKTWLRVQSGFTLRGPRDTPRLTAKTWLKMKGSIYVGNIL
jgi:hypothetical protein